MILPLSCHGTFPRALALIEWKLNLLTFFSVCYSLVHRATVHKIQPKFWFPISLKTDQSLLSLTSVLRFLSVAECIMRRSAPVQLLCLLWEGFDTLSIVCFSSASFHSVWSVAVLKWMQPTVIYKTSYPPPPFCRHHYVVASYFIFHIKSNTMGNIAKWICIKNITD